MHQGANGCLIVALIPTIDDRSPIARLLNPARSIFESPAIFKRQALPICTQTGGWDELFIFNCFSFRSFVRYLFVGQCYSYFSLFDS